MPFNQSLRLLSCLALIGAFGFTGCRTNNEPAVTWTLTGTVWKVAELNGQMVGADIIPTLQLETGGSRLRGFGGVNNISGTYKLEGKALSFGPLVSTRMAGPAKQMQVEDEFLKVLGSVTNYKASGQWLVLLAGETVVGRAQATSGAPFPKP